jgi:hypothetical protein
VNRFFVNFFLCVGCMQHQIIKDTSSTNTQHLKLQVCCLLSLLLSIQALVPPYK